MRLDYAVPG